MSLLILSHMGLGDMLICNGMVRHLAASGRQVLVACKYATTTSIKFMYRDLPNVHLLPVSDDHIISPNFGGDGTILRALDGAGYDLMLLGLHRGHLLEGSGFADAFYNQALVPTACRYSHFHVERDRASEQRFMRAGSYVFKHDDPGRGFVINLQSSLPIVEPGGADDREGSDNIFNFLGLMEHAAEIHTFDTSWAWLADLFDLCPGRRYLYANVKNPSDRCEDLFKRPGWHFVR